MFKKIGMFCIGALLSTQVLAANHSLAPNLSIEYDLKPSNPEKFANFTLFEVKAECVLQTTEPQAIIHVLMEKRSGTIDKLPISQGEERDLLIENGTVLELKVQSAAVVELENRSNSVIHASCRTVK
ncbi:hypothetical protein Lbir_0214 [Legionella birminghamensis]|uniref:Uncharacterized protein n=1 Tax=Legionella birminghamensis TaxID=28083 RepID=A0A378ICD3_9GAMM|nr:hypothetical protein [Legionella birminghamensis]KTC76145.1 hypothetical protein Lbir_0214 [Legionella birminghamensis]STX32231.1 Uncharacterised protein [Legionella birminghamensis]